LAFAEAFQKLFGGVVVEFLDRVLESGISAAEVRALACGEGTGMTYGEIYAASGRVYAYLQGRGIGRNDTVVIHMARGIETICAMLGVWRAGAALTVCEYGVMPLKRVDYIKDELKCALELTDAVYAEAMTLEPREGRADISEHDPAFAVYTSGSTGNPKGVIHEFGKLDIILNVDKKADYDHVSQVVGCLAPLNTIVSILLLVPALANRGVLDIIPYAVIKDPARLIKYISINSISMMFMPPALLKALPVLPKPLSVVFAGSERASEIWRPGIKIFNGYALSESGFTALYHTAQEGETEVPVGVSLLGFKAFLVDEDRKPTTGSGELVIENPYTRGYVNPELNKGVFEDGLLYTGDIASYNPETGFTLLGRGDDMIKLRGNRVEPAEIENAVKKALGLKWACARGCEGAVCVYYCENVGFDADELRKELSRTLPAYMIPRYFTRIEKTPLLPSGKLNRMALPQPVRTDALSTYAPPETPLEEKLCRAFADTLKLESVGVHDDYYAIGGDSVNAMALLNSLDEDITIETLLMERTPRRIAEAVSRRAQLPARQELDRLNEEARRRPHPLTPMQRYVLRYHMYTPNTTMWNLPAFMRFDTKLIPAQRMKEIMEKLIAAHPALQTTINLNREGYLEQKWSPELQEEITVERISENELISKRDDLVQPFNFGDVPLHRVRIFETERAGYLFFDIHHSVTDGFSMRNLRSDFVKLFNGQEPEPDYYFLNVEEDLSQKGQPMYKEAERYYSGRYSSDNWARYPKPDYESRKNTAGVMEINVPIRRSELEAMKRYYGVTTNELCMAAFMLSIARYNNCEDVHCVWNYHGRNDAMRRNSVGLMFRMMPVALHFSDGMTYNDAFESLREQFRKCTLYNCYPFALDMFDPSSQDRASCFFQTNIFDSADFDALGIESLEISDRFGASCGILDMSCVENDDAMVLHVNYNSSRYEKSSMRRFTSLVARHIMGMQQNRWDTIKLERSDK